MTLHPATGGAIELFEELVALAPEPRRRRLDELGDRDPGLAARVRRMLAADAGAPLEREHLLAAAAGGLDAGARIGPYRVVRELGRGGMGVVYLAERADGAFEQQVAIKVVGTFAAGEELVRRFELERSLLARLDHPGITRILDGGVTGRGEPYLVMEYVAGEPLDDYCDRLRLPVARRLELFAEVCRAIHYAHRALVVHRDLKPENILVTAEGRPKLVDFGIAKLLEGDGAQGATVTLLGARPFTPEYASPEQILGEPVSTASDVYSLGVVLYELLTGGVPFSYRTRAPAELVRSAERRRAELPSSRLAELDPEAAARRAAVRGTQPRGLEKEVRGDLDRIVAKALDPDPEQRYASADQLADDVRRHLGGLPVLARPASLGYQARKFVRRNRLLVTAAGLILALVLGGFGAALWQRGVAIEAQERAELEASRTRSINRFLASLFETGSARPFVERQHKGPLTPIVDVLEEASRRLEGGDVAAGPVELSDLHHALGDSFLSIGVPERAAVHFERSLELRREALGEVHEDTARAWYYTSFLAPTLAEEISAKRRSIEIEERLAQPSTNYPFALADLAGALTEVGRLEEAGHWLDRAAAATADLEEDHLARFNVLTRQLDLALASGDLERVERLVGLEEGRGRFDEPYQRQAFQALRGTVALLSGQAGDAVARLAAARGPRSSEDPMHVEALVFAGRLGEAERRAAELWAGDPRPYSYRELLDAESLAGLARLDHALGRYEACARRARLAAETIRREVASTTLPLARAEATLGECLLALGRPAEASPLLEEGHRFLRDGFGADLWETRRVADLAARARARSAS